MPFSDVSSDIAAVASAHHFHKQDAALTGMQAQLQALWLSLLIWLEKVFNIPLTGTGDHRIMSQMLKLSLYLIGLVTIAVVAFLLASRARAMRENEESERAGAIVQEPILDARGWRQQAQELAKSGEHRGACRALYLSSLSLLSEAGIAEFAPTRTNYEYYYALAKYPGIQAEFKRLSTLVEYAWFGHRQTSAGEYDEALAFSDKLEREVQNRTGSRPVAPVRPYEDNSV